MSPATPSIGIVDAQPIPNARTQLDQQQNNEPPPITKQQRPLSPPPDPVPPPGINGSFEEAPIGLGWSEMAKNVSEVDKQKIRDYKEDIDTILVFAGLFSAVMTAFLVESYENLQQDSSAVMVALMQQMVRQTHSYTINAGFLNSTTPLTIEPPPFKPTFNAVRVNALWFASLIISLISASFGILVKQWLREYLAGEYTSPQARLRVRHFRNPGLSDWKVFEIASILPLMLQFALALFFIGLCLFTADVHNTVGHITLPLVAGWAFLFIVASIAPALSPRCPYKTTLLKSVMRDFRSLLYHLILNSRHLLNLPNEANPLLPRDWTYEMLAYNEERAAADPKNDMDILIAVDSIQSDEQLLSNMWYALQQTHSDPADSITFLLKVLGHRLQRDLIADPSPFFLDLRHVSKPTVAAVMGFASEVLQRELIRQSPALRLREIEWFAWMKDCVYILLSQWDGQLTSKTDYVISLCLTENRHKHTVEFIKTRVSDPDSFPHILQRLQGAFRYQRGENVFPVLQCLVEAYHCQSQPISRIPLIELIRNHSEIPPSHLQQLVDLLIDCFTTRFDPDKPWYPWFTDMMDLLLELSSTASASGREAVIKLVRSILLQPRFIAIWCRYPIGLYWEMRPHVREAAQEFFFQALLSSHTTERRDILQEFQVKARWQWRTQPEADDNSWERSFRMDPLAACHLQLRLLKTLQERQELFDGYNSILKSIWSELYGGMRVVMRRKYEGHSDLAKSCLTLIDQMEPFNDDDSPSFEAWAKSLDLEVSFITDELISCLTMFLPFEEATFCARVRRSRLLSPDADRSTPRPPSSLSTVSSGRTLVVENRAPVDNLPLDTKS